MAFHVTIKGGPDDGQTFRVDGLRIDASDPPPGSAVGRAGARLPGGGYLHVAQQMADFAVSRRVPGGENDCRPERAAVEGVTAGSRRPARPCPGNTINQRVS